MDKIIYFSRYEGEYGEAEAMFNEAGTPLDMWSCDDAQWRGEYFDHLMKSLGITVDYSGKFNDKMESVIKQMWGY